MTLKSMRGHLTDACDHDTTKWCQKCEHGCVRCGALEVEQDDSGYCPECAEVRAEFYFGNFGGGRDE